MARPRHVLLKAWAAILIPAMAYAQGPSKNVPAGYTIIYSTDFNRGFDGQLRLQAPTNSSLTIVDSPGGRGGKAVKVDINDSDDFSSVANGVPRAEVSLANIARFQAGKDYFIAWSTYIPADYQFDLKQPESIAQIHEGPNKGQPPWGIVLTGGHYQVDLRGGPESGQHIDIGNAQEDKGSWVDWGLHYKPDPTGAGSVTELYKNGTMVLDKSGVPNAYPGDDQSYFKVGIYKWWWKTRPSDVSRRILYITDVSIGSKE